MGERNTSVKEATVASTELQDSESQVEETQDAADESIAPPAAPEVTLDMQIAAATAILEANGFVVKKRNAPAQRAVMEKAEPTEVEAYFASTGLNRKEIADAVGVTVSVIATVQNPNGDRWSAIRFAAAKILIDAYVAAKAAAAAPAVVETETTDESSETEETTEG